MLGHFVRHALGAQNWKGDPRQIAGVLIIDEIDLHLHPKWQREIVSNLCSVFPNIQFIFSSHSPLVASSLSPHSTLLLKRSRDKVLPLRLSDLGVDSFVGWRADQILTGSGFDLDTTMSNSTVELLNEYEQLLAMSGRTLERENQLKALSLQLEEQFPHYAETPEARKAAYLFKEWLQERLSTRPQQEVEAIFTQARKIIGRIEDASGGENI